MGRADDPGFKALARLAVREGVNIQPQQALMIQAPIEARQLVRCIAQAAYDEGAGLVHCHYEDPELLRIAVTSMDPERSRPARASSFWSTVAANQPAAARLHIIGPRPRLLQGIATERLLYFHKLFEGQEPSGAVDTACCALPFATRDWATWIRPELDASAAQATLWNDILHLCDIHSESLPQPEGLARHRRMGRVADWLNRLQLVSLHLRDRDTDLSVGLLPQVAWQGGVQRTAAGLAYLPCLPSGPVCSLLQGSATRGLLSVKQSITIGAKSVCDLKLEFREGRVSGVSASQGAEVMEQLLQADANAARLGQIGLLEAPSVVVPPQHGFMAPIMDTACGMHLTLGCPATAKHQPGANHSDIGVDLMFADVAMAVDGVDASGTTVPLFRNGRFCLAC